MMRALRIATRTLVASLAMVVLTAASAQAQNPITPVVEEIRIECAVRAGQQHTVTLKMRYFMSSDSYEFLFTNAQGQQLRFYELMSSMGTGTFPVPTGTYSLSVSIVGRSNPNSPTLMPGTAVTTYRNIVVPPILSTGGRGTGCRFSQ